VSDVTVDVRLEVGSCRTWITVGGGLLLGVYSFVGNYKGFLESIDLMCGQARQYAVDVCSAVRRESGASPTQVYRMERRLKTPGKIRRLIDELEELDKIAPKLSRKDYDERLAEITRRIEAIRRDLTEEEMAALNKTLRYENLPPLRQIPERHGRPEMPRAAVRDEEAEVELFHLEQQPANIGLDEVVKEPDRIVFHRRAYVPPGKEKAR
jgi:hypothetical protein